MDKRFRFVELEIWRHAVQMSGTLFGIADRLDQQKRFRFAEQLRAATLSITNNIAEGSGSTSDAEFAQFLNISRRSTFEVANILMVLSSNNELGGFDVSDYLTRLDEQSRMTLAFIRRLRSQLSVPSSAANRVGAKTDLE
jgi:four helix bundle protein